MTAHAFIGIDPGLSGAIAVIDMRASHINVVDMPLHTITRNGKAKRQLDLYQLGNWFDLHRNTIKLATIEAVHSMPAQGITSAFTFGFAAGALQGLVAGNAIPMHLVAPLTWKRAFKLTSDKDASRRAASQLFPAFSHLWARAKDDGRAEAVLLAYYGSKLQY